MPARCPGCASNDRARRAGAPALAGASAPAPTWTGNALRLVTRRDRGVARDRRAGPRAARATCAFVSHVLFPLGAAVGLALAVVAFFAIGPLPQSTVLPLGLPDLPFHLRLDSLSAFFLLLLGAAGAAISMFAAGYFRSGEGDGAGPAVLRVPRCFSPRWRWC